VWDAPGIDAAFADIVSRLRAEGVESARGTAETAGAGESGHVGSLF
jgi:hypothetical protein